MAKTVVKPRNDAYTGLLAISFLALVAATVLMAMDAQSMGDPPQKFQVNVPGTTAGKAGEGLKRPSVGEGGPAPAEKGKEGARAEPRELPPLPGVAAAGPASPVVPVKAEDPAAPPLPPPSFVPPQ